MKYMELQMEDFKNRGMQKQNNKALVDNKNKIDMQLLEANRNLATLENDYAFKKYQFT